VGVEKGYYRYDKSILIWIPRYGEKRGNTEGLEN